MKKRYIIYYIRGIFLLIPFILMVLMALSTDIRRMAYYTGPGPFGPTFDVLQDVAHTFKKLLLWPNYPKKQF